MCAERGDVGVRGPGQTAGRHRRGSARRPHPAVGSGGAGGAAAAGVRPAADCEPEPAVAGPRGAVRPPQLRVRGGEAGRQAPGADPEEGELPGESRDT